MLVGFHEMAGNREKGCWRHSILPHPITRAYSAVEGIWLNDLLVGEIGIFVAFAGIHNVPAVLNTGDYWACLEAEDLVPGIETVAVKKGTSHFSAISLTPQAAAEAAAEGAVRALGKIGVVEPLKMEGPVTLKVKYTFAERATDAMSAVANAFRIDEQTVAATYPSIAAVRDNLGNLRAPEMEIYAKDSGFAKPPASSPAPAANPTKASRPIRLLRGRRVVARQPQEQDAVVSSSVQLASSRAKAESSSSNLFGGASLLYLPSRLQESL